MSESHIQASYISTPSISRLFISTSYMCKYLLIMILEEIRYMKKIKSS